MLLFKRIVLMVVLSLLSGCYFLSQPPPQTPPPPTTLPDWGLFSSSQCTINCWQNLQPGQTTREEVEHFLNSQVNSNYQVVNYGDYTLYTGRITVVTKDNILYRMELPGLSNLTLGDILRVLGNPDKIDLQYYLPSNANARNVMLQIYYPNKGYIFYFDIRGGLDVKKISDSEVEICFKGNILPGNIIISEPSPLETFISKTYPPQATVPSQEQLNAFIVQLKEWPQSECQHLPILAT